MDNARPRILTSPYVAPTSLPRHFAACVRTFTSLPLVQVGLSSYFDAAPDVTLQTFVVLNR